MIFKLTIIQQSSRGHLLWNCFQVSATNLTNDEVMAWCHQATSHYLGQYWIRSVSPYGITRSQWVNLMYIHAYDLQKNVEEDFKLTYPDIIHMGMAVVIIKNVFSLSPKGCVQNNHLDIIDKLIKKKLWWKDNLCCKNIKRILKLHICVLSVVMGRLWLVGFTNNLYFMTDIIKVNKSEYFGENCRAVSELDWFM